MRLLVLLVGALACSSDPAEPAVAENPFLPRWVTPAGDTLALREDLRIGVMDGPDEYAFATVADMALGPDGTIYIYDLPEGSGHQVRQYSPDGKFVRPIGRGGAGPGEYSQWFDMAVLANGDLLIADENEHSRLLQYRSDGTLRNTHTGESGNGRNILIPTPNNGWITEINWRPVGRENGWVHALAKYDSTGRLLDTIPPSPEQVATGKFALGDRPEGIGRSYQAALPNGDVVIANSLHPNLIIRRNESVDTIARALDPQRYSDLEIKGLIPQYQAAARRARQDPSKVELPEFKPVYRWVGTLDSGQIFAWMHGPVFPYDDSERGEQARGFRGIRVTDLLEGNGKWIGRLLEVVPYAFKADTIWGTALTDEGVQYVGRWVIGS